MSDGDPIAFRQPPESSRGARSTAGKAIPPTPSVTASTGSTKDSQGVVVFNRLELSDIFNVYGRRVASGEWRDYAIDWGRDTAVFSIFRRASEMPIYRIVKSPRLARKQGAYSVVTATGLILKRGHDLKRVLDVIDARLQVVK